MRSDKNSPEIDRIAAEIIGQSKGQVIPIDYDEVVLLARLEKFTIKHGLSLVCVKCDSAVTGGNNASSPSPSVSCQCREWRGQWPDQSSKPRS
jgi:hypothetical protein